MKITKVIKGIIKRGYNDSGFNTIDIVQKDGYKINLINYFDELTYNYGKEVTIKYWTAKSRQTDDNIKKGALYKFFGIVDAKFEREDYQYSEYTRGTDYNTILNVGDHHLYDELLEKEDKYLLLEINFDNKNN